MLEKSSNFHQAECLCLKNQAKSGERLRTRMAWERQGRYYYRTRKVGGRVVREYIGTGQVADLVAQMDALEREREAERAARRAEKARLEALDAPLNQLNDLADLLARAALVVAGFRQHKRGEWRKRRGNCRSAE